MPAKPILVRVFVVAASALFTLSGCVSLTGPDKPSVGKRYVYASIGMSNDEVMAVMGEKPDTTTSSAKGELPVQQTMIWTGDRSTSLFYVEDGDIVIEDRDECRYSLAEFFFRERKVFKKKFWKVHINHGKEVGRELLAWEWIE